MSTILERLVDPEPEMNSGTSARKGTVRNICMVGSIELFAQRGEPDAIPIDRPGNPPGSPQCGAPQRRQEKLFELPRLFKLQKGVQYIGGRCEHAARDAPRHGPVPPCRTRRTGTLILRAIDTAR